MSAPDTGLRPPVSIGSGPSDIALTESELTKADVH